MQRVKIFLRSGQTVEFDCKEFSTAKNGFGKTVQITWTNAAEGRDNLHMVSLEDVVAITYSDI